MRENIVVVNKLCGTWESLLPKNRADEEKNSYAAWIESNAHARIPIATPEQITSQRIQAYLIALRKIGLMPRSQKRHLSAISTFCQYLVTEGLLESNPARNTIVQSPEKTPPGYLTPAEIRMLLRAVHNTAIYLPVLFCLYTGARLREMIGQTWADWDANILRNPKTKKWRLCNWPAALAKRIERTRRPSAEYLFPQMDRYGYDKRLRGVIAELHLPEFEAKREKWHLMRSTWATYLAASGCDTWELAGRGGWSNLQTPMIYINVANMPNVKRFLKQLAVRTTG